MQRLVIFSLLVAAAVAIAPYYSASIPSDRVDGSYIVVYERETPFTLVAQHQAKLLDMDQNHVIRFNYTNTIIGFSGYFTQAGVEFLRQFTEVKYIEEDALAYALACASQDVGSIANLWGLGRIDQRAVNDLNTFIYDTTAGAGVRAYVFDTGIRITHSEFGGRATWGNNFMGDGRNSDYHGHGTHVAGTITGATYGVAKLANAIAVKVLGDTGSGSYAGIIAGVDWANDQVASRRGQDVANFSLGGGRNAGLDDAIAVFASNIAVAVAAGNSNIDAINFSPAAANNVYTVGASTISDSRASFSNYGSTLEIFAPGENIRSCAISSDTASSVLSGTSMAAPHVAGVAAVAISANGGTFLPADLLGFLQSTATAGSILNPGTGSPNLLLYTSC